MPLTAKIATAMKVEPAKPVVQTVTPFRVMSKGVASTQTEEVVSAKKSQSGDNNVVVVESRTGPGPQQQLQEKAIEAPAAKNKVVMMVLKKKKKRDPNRSSAVATEDEPLNYDPNMSSVFQSSFKPVAAVVERARIPPPAINLNVEKAKFG